MDCNLTEIPLFKDSTTEFKTLNSFKNDLSPDFACLSILSFLFFIVSRSFICSSKSIISLSLYGSTLPST